MTTVKNGAKVFIAGSRSLSRLSKDVKQRIDNIIAQGLAVIVGDANGVDKAVQLYLKGRHYDRVTVFCMAGGCRNNAGSWPTQAIAAPESSRRDFAYYSTKDRAMVEEADYGLMLWDGKSRGTLRSVVDLVQHEKPVIVYVASGKSFHTLKRPTDLANILSHADPAVVAGIDPELRSIARGGGPNRKSDGLRLF
jgi:hypothetical protein